MQQSKRTFSFSAAARIMSNNFTNSYYMPKSNKVMASAGAPYPRTRNPGMIPAFITDNEARNPYGDVNPRDTPITSARGPCTQMSIINSRSQGNQCYGTLKDSTLYLGSDLNMNCTKEYNGVVRRTCEGKQHTAYGTPITPYRGSYGNALRGCNATP
jgi:hypothetical protein